MNMDTNEPEKKKSRTMEKDYDGEPLTFVEFYAGIGGWSMALAEALQRCAPRRHLVRLAALDHSDLCLKVLEHNSPSKERTSSIERLTLNQVQAWNASVWCMSPPCQPHTRQHENQKKDLEDPRSQSFLHLCNLLEQMQESKLPKLLLMENVVGFETVRSCLMCPSFICSFRSFLDSRCNIVQSNSCQRWRQVLSRRKYKVAHFHLNPTQVGIPNDRPRYYSVAVLSQGITENACLSNYLDLETYLQALPMIQTSIPKLGVASPENVNSLPPISNFLDVDKANRGSLTIPDKILESRAAWCFDIVTSKDRRSSCFTQSYGKFIRGTGSVLWESNDDNNKVSSRFTLLPPEEREFNPNWAEGLNLKENLRYFSGREVARLMGFDESFSFPEDCSMKQQWKLLGNSLNVRVAARIAELGMHHLT